MSSSWGVPYLGTDMRGRLGSGVSTTPPLDERPPGARVRLYPDVPARRARTVARDVAVVLLLGLFAWLGVTVHDTIDQVAVLGSGVAASGTAVQDGFDQAADAVEDIPLVGDDVAGGLSAAGGGTGGQVAELGRQGEDSVHDAATLLGILTFALPAALLLALTLPGRVRQVRALTAAAAVLRGTDDPERRRLVASRAAFGLPYGTLLEYTADPIGDLAAGRHDSLVAAALDDAGIRRSAQHLGGPGDGDARAQR